MSAIAKPMARFTGSQKVDILVPVEWVHSATKRDSAVSPGSPTVYYIDLTLVYPTGASKDIHIPFATSGARNTSFTNYETAFVTSVA